MKSGFKFVTLIDLSMLDMDVDHVRVDRLREYIEAQIEETEKRRVDAVKRKQSHTASKSTGEVKAFEKVLLYLDTMTDNRDGRQLERIR